MFYKKDDPLVDSVRKVMEQNEKERQAAAAVNDAFGIQDRKALPHERQGDWDAVYKKVLTEGVEVLDEISKKLAASYVKGASTDLADRADPQYDDFDHDDDFEDEGRRKSDNRMKGIHRAVDRMSGTKKKKLKEEQLDEGVAKAGRTKAYLATISKDDPDYKSKLDTLKKGSGSLRVRGRLAKDASPEVRAKYKRDRHGFGPRDVKVKDANRVDVYKRKMDESQMEEGLKMNDYGHSKEVNKKKRLAKILKYRMGKGDGKESVEQSRREDK